LGATTEIQKQNLQGINVNLKKSVIKMEDQKEKANAIKEINALHKKSTVTEKQMN
jgi:hypothetical protein